MHTKVYFYSIKSIVKLFFSIFFLAAQSSKEKNIGKDRLENFEQAAGHESQIGIVSDDELAKVNMLD